MEYSNDKKSLKILSSSIPRWIQVFCLNIKGNPDSLKIEIIKVHSHFKFSLQSNYSITCLKTEHLYIDQTIP